MISTGIHYSARFFWHTRIRSPYKRNTTQATFLTSPFSTRYPRYSENQAAPVTDLNSATPPPTTLPPPLHLPVRQSDASTFSYYLSLGKAYVTFYKTGIKSIYQNYKLSRILWSRIAPHTPDEALKRNLLSRGEHLLLRRTSQDVRKIPSFLLLYIVCGELTPFAVVLFNGMVPRTLWIPKQVQTSREIFERRRMNCTHRNRSGSLDKADDILSQGQFLGCYPLWWDRLPIPPTWLIRRRVMNRENEINLDDFALRRDGGVQAIKGEEEVRMAAELRALNILGKSEEELREQLGLWLLEGTKNISTPVEEKHNPVG